MISLCPGLALSDHVNTHRAAARGLSVVCACQIIVVCRACQIIAVCRACQIIAVCVA